jgi:hypothetical protein
MFPRKKEYAIIITCFIKEHCIAFYYAQGMQSMVNFGVLMRFPAFAIRIMPRFVDWINPFTCLMHGIGAIS